MPKNPVYFSFLTLSIYKLILIKKVFIFDLEYCAEAASSKFKTLYGKLLEKNKELTSFNFLTSKLDEIACKFLQNSFKYKI